MNKKSNGKSRISGALALAAALLAPQAAQSQGTFTYLTTLSQKSVGSQMVGSDSWVASEFQTGGNPGGYALDSLDVAMTQASGAPDGFTVQLYSWAQNGTGAFPGNSLGSFTGSTDPETAGIYNYTASGLTVRPSTWYFIVFSAGTAVETGSYNCSISEFSSSTGGWSPGGGVTTSYDNGEVWNYELNNPQFNLSATAIPEPGPLSLIGIGGAFLLAWRRLRGKA